MPSLKEALAAKRGSEPSAPSSCDTTYGPGPILVLKKWNGESWVIPWSRLARIKCTSEESDAFLELIFDNFSVLLHGYNLAGILEELGAFKVLRLRELPPEYRATMPATEPFVTRIDLKVPEPQNDSVSFSAAPTSPADN